MSSCRATNAKVNVALRRRAREICPAWDLLGGSIDDQLMGGTASVWDPVLICRETAWMLHHEIAPDIPLEDFRGSLKSADELTQLQLVTRHAHRELPDSDGSQMMLNVEYLLPGAQLFHGFVLHGLERVSRLTAACMADLVSTFVVRAQIGAKSASGAGAIACEAYLPRSDDSTLPSAEEYTTWVAEHRDEIRAWLLGQDALADTGAPTNGGAKRGRGRGKAPPAPVEESDAGL